FLNGKVGNTYPLGFLMFFAYLFVIWNRLPKLIFVVAFLVSSYQLYHLLFKSGKFDVLSEKRRFWAVMYILWSPLSVLVVWEGQYDSTLGLLVFNLFLLWVNHPRYSIKKELISTFLILSVAFVKFVGIFLVIPYILHDLKNNDSNKKKMYKLILLRVLIFACLFIVLFLILIFVFDTDAIITPFLVQSKRSYRTFFQIYKERFGVELTMPFFLMLFVSFYSNFGLYIFLGMLASSYLMSLKKKISAGGQLLIPLLVFLAFFPASHVQFIFWIIHSMTLYLIRAKDTSSSIPKFFYFQAIGLGVFFFVPFVQFFYLYYILEIFKVEKQASIPEDLFIPARNHNSKENH
ncbi:MAG: hypothetical protein ACTSXU_12200, partial [Promethearchaeota archaeon]